MTGLWTAVDDYISERLIAPDPVLDQALEATAAAGLAAINVAPNQGKLLHILARSIGARRVLEVGALGGYSTIWLARALPADGRLITLEIDPVSVAVTRRNLEAAGLGDVVQVREGAALDSLPALAEEAPFDLVFIDADKKNNVAYFDHALSLTRRGGLIVIDNVVRQGWVLEAGSPDESVKGTRALFDRLAREPRVTVTAIQTVGAKGHDGLAVALVN